jgi:hypothetical protein
VKEFVNAVEAEMSRREQVRAAKAKYRSTERKRLVTRK